MDFSTINSQTGHEILPLLRQAMTSVTRFERDDLLSVNHAGGRLRKLKLPYAKTRATHRHGTGLHAHVWHEICLPVGGQCCVETNHDIYAFDTPAIAIFTPGMVHCERRINRDSQHAMLWLSFGRNYVLAMLSIYVPINVWHTPLRWPVTGRLASQMAAALPHVLEPNDSHTGPSHLETFRMTLLALLADVYRQAMKPARKPVSDNPLGHHHVELLQQLVLFVEQHLDQQIRLEQLASIAHMSPNHLNTLFRRWTGLPMHAWIVKKRMDKAMQLLKHPGKLAKQVALDVGYSDPLYFSRAFHKQFGYWPSEAKERNGTAQ